MENEGARGDGSDLGKMVKVDLGLILEPVDITDRDGEQVASRSFDKFRDLVGIGLAVRLAHMVIFLAANGA